MADFSDYRMSDLARNERGVYELADNLIPDMARQLHYELDEFPGVDSLQGFINHINPSNSYLDNVKRIEERLLSTKRNAVDLVSNWVSNSGILEPVTRSFSAPMPVLPKNVDTALFSTSAGPWQERRAQEVMRLQEQGYNIGHVVIFAGNREMAKKEHEMVGRIAAADAAVPTEARFATVHIAEMLKSVGLSATVASSETGSTDEIIVDGLKDTVSDVLDGTVVVIGNAPATLHVAGQFRHAARQVDDSFDKIGTQLYMSGDGATIDRYSEAPVPYLNPSLALSQIARSGLMLHLAAETLI
jgi:hypothetical protein